MSTSPYVHTSLHDDDVLMVSPPLDALHTKVPVSASAAPTAPSTSYDLPVPHLDAIFAQTSGPHTAHRISEPPVLPPKTLFLAHLWILRFPQ